MEDLRGKDALRNLPLNQVFISFAEALELLTRRTLNAINSNFDLAIRNIMNDPQSSQLIQSLNEVKEYYLRNTNGGFSLTIEELKNIYDAFGNLTFKNFLDFFFSNVADSFTRTSHSREPGVIVLGYLLDFLYILQPKIATFDNGVEILVELMREKPSAFLNPFVMGAMVDDSRNLRTSKGIFFDPFMSPEEVDKFDNVFSSFLNAEEKEIYKSGKEIDIHELALKTIGTTLN